MNIEREPVDRRDPGDHIRGVHSAEKSSRWDVGSVGFALTLGVLAAGCALGYQSTRRMVENNRMVFHTQEVAIQLEMFQSTLTEAETGQRGYLLAGEESYLDVYENAIGKIDSEFQRLKTLTSDDLRHRVTLASMGKNVDDKLIEMRQTIELMKRGDRDAALEVVDSDIGKSLMDDVRNGIVSMQQVEQALLRQRVNQSEDSYRLALLSIVSSTLVGMALVAVVFFLAQRNVRQRRYAAEVLAEQRERYRTTLGCIGDAVISTDLEGRVVYLNQVAETLTGWSNAEASGVPLPQVFRIVNEGTRAEVESPAVKALREGVIVGLANHTVLISKTGTERPIDDSAAPIRDSDGQITGCVLVFRDITERKQAEDELREARSRQESTLAAAEIGTWEFDPIQNDIRLDSNLTRMFGESQEATVKWSLEDYLRAIHADDRERVGSVIRQALANEENYEIEYRIVSFNGKVRWVVARGRVERDSAGRPVRLPGVLVDITERKQAEKDLIVSEARLQLALDAAELGSWHIDPATLILQTDERFNLIFGGSTEPLSYEQAFAIIHEDDRDRVRDAVHASLQPDNPVPYASEYRVVHPNGVIRWIFGKGRASFDEIDGERRLTSFDGTVMDITEQRQMREELSEIAARLSEADRRKTEFLATLGHELRNPLAPIRTGLEAMKLAADEPETLVAIRSTMERQVKQMVHLIDDLLDVSRITYGKMELRLCQVSLSEIVQSAVEATQPYIDEAGHELTVSMPAQSILLSADPNRLAQVFSNLLNNAAKYTHEGGQLALIAELQGSEVLVSVKDNGLGIPADMLDHIFEMFAQIDRPVEKDDSGLGIGLTLVKRLVELHSGSIEVRSEGAGKGSEFSVRLPILSVTDETDVPSSGVAESRPAGRKLRVLIVDDNKAGANMLSMVVKMLGNEIRTAHDGIQGVKAAEEFFPDIVLMDLGMPKMNGYEAARAIRQQPWGKEILLVALTGWGQDEDRQRTQEAGFDVHVVKPVEPAELQRLFAKVNPKSV